MKDRMNYVQVVGGVILLALGLVLIKAIENPEGFMVIFPYLSIGTGSGFFGKGVGGVFSQRVFKEHPEIFKEMQIEKNDERNVFILQRAKAKAFDVMTFMFGTLMISLALMGMDIKFILLLVLSYAFIHSLVVYFRVKLERKL